MRQSTTLEEVYNSTLLFYKNDTRSITAYDSNGDVVLSNENKEICQKCIFKKKCGRHSNIFTNPNFIVIKERLQKDGVITSHFNLQVENKNKPGEYIKQRIDYKLVKVLNKDNNLEGYIMVSTSTNSPIYKTSTLSEKQQNILSTLYFSRIMSFRYNISTKKMLVFEYGEEISIYWDELKKIIHPDDIDKIEKQIKKLASGIKSKHVMTIRWKFIGKKYYRFYELTMQVITNEEGKRDYIIGTLRDCTEQITKEKELSETRRKFDMQNKLQQAKNEKINTLMNLAIKAYGVNIWEYNIKEGVFHSILTQDKSFILEGYTIENIESLLDDDSLDTFHEMVEGMNQGNLPKQVVVLGLHNPNNGHKMYHKNACALLKDENGKLISLVGAQKDITSNINQKNSIKHYQKELESANSCMNYALVMNKTMPFLWHSNKDAFIVLSPENRAKFDNVFHKSYKYYSKAEILRCVHPDDKAIIRKAVDNLSKGKKTEIEFNCRYDAQKRFNHIFSVKLMPYTIANDNDTFIGFMQDITEKHSMMQQLVQGKLKAEESEKLKSNFLANMSHEIRTPLNAIVGFSQLLGEDYPKQEREEFIDIINGNSQVLLKLIDDILEVSRLEAGRLERKVAPFDLHELFMQGFASYKLQFKKPNIQLILDIPQERQIVWLDRRRVYELINNFVSNAAKYTDKGHIRIGYRKISEQEIRVFVEDTGKGMTKENASKVFARFEKLGSFIQGAGLGLAICKTYIEDAGGKIGVDSTEGKGSTFWAIYPIDKDADKEKDVRS